MQKLTNFMISAFKINDPSTMAALKLLKGHNMRIDARSLREGITRHPDYPSMLTLSDIVSKYGLNPNAFQTFVTVTKVSPNTITYYSDSGILSDDPRQEFIKKFTGLVLFIEPDTEIKRVVSNKYRISDYQILNRSFLLLSGIILLLASLLIWKLSGTPNLNIRLGFVAMYMLKLCGIIICVFLLMIDIDRSNPFLQKICHSNTGSSCEKVLNSNYSKILNSISLSEIGLVYFSAGLFLLLFQPGNLNTSLQLLAWMNLLALPFTVFSIYYQWKIVTKKLDSSIVVSQLEIYLFSISIFLPIFIWSFLKPLLITKVEFSVLEKSHIKFKFNIETFNYLLRIQDKVKVLDPSIGVLIGNRTAENLMIIVTNPFCNGCAEAHKEITELLKFNKNIKVQIIFMEMSSKNDKYALPVQHLLSIAERVDSRALNKAIEDWFEIGKDDYQKFKMLYPEMSFSDDFIQKINDMDKWCKNQIVNFTPLVFFNGYQLPEIYKIKDLEYLVLS